ncbi:hypothetical protein ABVV53_08705 [Novosphingobium sp. RD2P27]|uniref:PD-(D/E)XK nuclease-like domain-containing protein n=1 Tax=Novosphingobium kalidii TaxID=3230299 RepID=A0ABV2D0Z9_9SPHN
MPQLPTLSGAYRLNLPIIPGEVLKRSHVPKRYDDRLKACGRLLQALWLRSRDIPMGVHRGRDGHARRLGSRLSPGGDLSRPQLSDAATGRHGQRVIAIRSPAKSGARS